MAAPMQHMAGAGQFMQQNRMGGGPQMDMSSYVFQTIQNNSIGIGPGWQASVPIAERVRCAQELITNMVLANQNQGLSRQQIADYCLRFELEVFTKSPDKSIYDQRIRAKIQEQLMKRQSQAPQIQQAMNAQAQQQMMMNQQQQQQQALLRAQMAGRGMGPGQQGFQHLQNPMQVSQLPQQAPQMGLSLSNGMNPQMTPNHPGFGMPGGPQRTPDQMGQMSEMDKQKVQQLALHLMSTTSDAHKQQLENQLNAQMTPQMRQQFQSEGKNVLLYYFQQQAFRRVQAMRHQTQMQQQQRQQQPGMPPNAQGMGMQPSQQRPMNPGMMNNMGQPGGQMGPGPFSNMESIMNEQKQGLLAESQGQLVVPASSGPGRNNTPQPSMGGMHSQNMFGQGPGQQQRPQMPGGLDLQQQALLKQQMAASAQAQRNLQGQPGGLSGPMPVSQTPAMENLNAPVQRPPVALGQMGGPPGMQGNPSFGPGLDARFNQQGTQAPMNGLANLSDPMMRAMWTQLTPEQQTRFRSMPPAKLNELFAKWKESAAGRATAMQAGRAGQQQMNPANQPNQMGGMPTPQPNGGMPPQMARMLGQGGQPNQMRMRPGANILQHPQAAALMDSMDVPPQVLRGIPPGVPPEIKKWSQLKAWVAQQQTPPVPDQIKQKLRQIQINLFQQFMASRGMGGAGAGPGAGQQQPGAPRPSPLANGPIANIEVTPQEIQSARNSNHERFKDVPDETVKNVIQQMKLRRMQASQMASQHQQQQQQQQHQQQHQHQQQLQQPGQPPVSQPGAPQAHLGAPQHMPQPQPTSGPPAAPEPHQNTPSVAQGLKPPRSAQPNKTMPPNPSPASAAKSLKRPSTDDLELSAQQQTPTAQRPPSQAGQGPMAGGSQSTPMSTSQIANMSLEEKQKFVQEGGQRFKMILGEEMRSFAPNKFPEVHVPAEQKAAFTAQLLQTTTGYVKIANILPRWFTEFRDESRLRMFIQARLRLLSHFEDAQNLQGVKNKFTLSAQDILNYRQLLGSILKECQLFNNKSGSQQPPQQNQPGPKQAPTQVANDANSQKQATGATKAGQRPGSRGFQPPAAPTSTHAPFQFGANSPDGRPQYVAPPAVTRENLQMPPTKKIKTGQQTSSPAVPGSQTASPQTKITSPELKKHEPKAVPKAPAFPCTMADCELGAPTFPTEALRKKHMEEFHVQPFQDAEKFLEQSLFVALDDVIEISTDNAPENSREASTKQLENAPTSQPAKLEDKAGATPKVAHGQPAVELQQSQTADNLGGTIDPQNLLAPLVPDMGIMIPGVINDLSLYRSTTPPEDTPESSKDSGVSDPNSDIPETGALDIEMSFQPFDDTMFDTLNFGNESFQPETITDDMLVNYDDPSFNKMQPLGDMSELWTFNC